MSWILGVDTFNKQITADQTDGKVGSWLGKALVADITDIVVATTGAVIQITGVPTVDTYDYLDLQGTASAIQKGFQYPNVYRHIKSTDLSGEWAYFNGGGLYPWDP